MKYRLGIDLGGSKIAGIIMDADDHVVSEKRIATPQGDYHATLRAIAELVAALEAASGVQGLPAGIGTPGSVVPATGRMRNANSQCLNDRPLPRDLEDCLQRPVRVANDADCLALSEYKDGIAAGAASVFAGILGTGVGGGIVIHGRLLTGINGLAGEWGHTPLPWMDVAEQGAMRCWCGQQDCPETWLSGPALAADYQRRCGIPAMRASWVAARAAAGETCAATVLAVWYDRLARALAGIINVLDPHVIVIGGGLSRIERLYIEVPQRWPRYAFTDEVVTAFRPALHGD